MDPVLALNPYCPSHSGWSSVCLLPALQGHAISPCFLVLAELGLVSKTQAASECSQAATLESVLGVPL